MDKTFARHHVAHAGKQQTPHFLQGALQKGEVRERPVLLDKNHGEMVVSRGDGLDLTAARGRRQAGVRRSACADAAALGPPRGLGGIPAQEHCQAVPTRLPVSGPPSRPTGLVYAWHTRTPRSRRQLLGIMLAPWPGEPTSRDGLVW